MRSCRLVRAWEHANGGPRPCGLTAPLEEAKASWEEVGRCSGLLPSWGKAGNHSDSRKTRASRSPCLFKAKLSVPTPSPRPRGTGAPPALAAHLWESGPAAHWGTCGVAGLAAARYSCPSALPRASGQSPGGFARPVCPRTPSKVNSHHELPLLPKPGPGGWETT